MAETDCLLYKLKSHAANLVKYKEEVVVMFMMFKGPMIVL